MAKKRKFSSKETRLLIGIVLVLIGVIGISNILSLLLIAAGGYLIYEGLKKS